MTIQMMMTLLHFQNDSTANADPCCCHRINQQSQYRSLLLPQNQSTKPIQIPAAATESSTQPIQIPDAATESINKANTDLCCCHRINQHSQYRSLLLPQNQSTQPVQIPAAATESINKANTDPCCCHRIIDTANTDP